MITPFFQDRSLLVWVLSVGVMFIHLMAALDICDVFFLCVRD